MQYDLGIEHISGAKNVVVDYHSRLVKNNMENNKSFNQQLIMTAGFYGFIIPDDAHNKIIKAHNSLVGQSGLERCLKTLTDSKRTWKYMHEHVTAFMRACPCYQKTSVLRIPIHGHPFTASTFEHMVRLSIDFVGTFTYGGYILTIIDTFTRWVKLYVCESADAQEAAGCLFEHFSRLASSQMFSDRGSHFVNHPIIQFSSHNIAYLKPTLKQENSLVERTNTEIKRHMTSLFFNE